MELLILVQEELPDKENGREIDKFIHSTTDQAFKTITGIDPSSGWNQPRPRRLVFYNFTYPEKAEKEILTRLKPYHVGSLTSLVKIFDIPILGSAFSKITGIMPVNLDEIPLDEEEVRKRRLVGVRIVILGKREDGHDISGLELL